MQSTMRTHTDADFGVTLHALERGLSAELVAGDAMARALQCPVGAGQRPWRNLSASGSRTQPENYQEKSSDPCNGRIG